MTASSPGAGAGVGVSPILPKPASGLIIASDFESKSHDELYAMVEHADVERTTLVAARLSSAAALLALLGDELKGHVSRVRWEGEAGEAFRVWGADMANATLRLGELSGSAGEWMAHAASTLSRVKSAMPKPSEARATLDAYRQANPERVGQVPSPLTTDQSGGLRTPGPTQRQAYEAQQAPAEAARLMRQLAESYAWSAHQLSVAPRPTFRPMPDLTPLPGDRDGVSTDPGSGGAGSTAPAGGPGQHTMLPPEYSKAPPGPGMGGDTHIAPVDRVEGLPSHASTVIDGITPQPPGPANSGLNNPVGIGGVGPGDNPFPGTVAPPLPRGGINLPDPGGRGPGSPGIAGPDFPGGSRRVTANPGLIGGATAAGNPRVPNDGIVGGRPVPRATGQTTGAVPRGTVVGAESTQSQGRPGMNPLPGTASPGGNMGSGAGRGATRRLASEPGGIVGGRMQQRPGAAGERPFTPGGTGLVRNAPVAEGSPTSPGGHGGIAPLQSTHGGAQQPGRRGQRPDYLTEDEESWTHSTRRRMVPPVID